MHTFFRKVTSWLLLAVLVSPVIWLFPKAVIYLDNKFLNEYVRFFYGRHVAGEDWSVVPVLPSDMDYRWMDAENKPLRIGHALGFSGTSLANQLEALPLARKLRLRVLEVDLWLAADGSVRCFHGPGDPGPLLESTCTFDRLIRATEASGEYLVLDIKTDFARTAAQVDSIMQKLPSHRRRLVFQLYKPNDVKTFAAFPNLKTYAGPIVTAYTSRSSLNDITQGSKHAGIRALTLPMQRQAAMDRKSAGNLRLYVHPVHNCTDLRDAEINGYDGIYTLAPLKC